MEAHPFLMSLDSQSNAPAGRTKIYLIACTPDVVDIICLFVPLMCPVCPLLNRKMGGTCFLMIPVFVSVQVFSLSHSPLPLSSLSPSLLPARPLQACCRAGLRDVTEGWSGSLLVGAEKMGRRLRGEWNARFFRFLKLHSSDRICVAVCTFTCVTLLTPLLLLCNPFMQRRETSPAIRSQCCWKNSRKNVSCQAVTVSYERAQLRPSAPAWICLFPCIWVISVACIAVGWHSDAARPHPHDKLRAIDPCAVQIWGSVVFFNAEYASVYCQIVRRLSIMSLNQLFRPTGDFGRPVWPGCVVIVPLIAVFRCALLSSMCLLGVHTAVVRSF